MVSAQVLVEEVGPRSGMSSWPGAASYWHAAGMPLYWAGHGADTELHSHSRRLASVTSSSLQTSSFADLLSWLRQEMVFLEWRRRGSGRIVRYGCTFKAGRRVGDSIFGIVRLQVACPLPRASIHHLQDFNGLSGIFGPHNRFRWTAPKIKVITLQSGASWITIWWGIPGLFPNKSNWTM